MRCILFGEGITVIQPLKLLRRSVVCSLSGARITTRDKKQKNAISWENRGLQRTFCEMLKNNGEAGKEQVVLDS